jgi:hypothetical protein
LLVGPAGLAAQAVQGEGSTCDSELGLFTVADDPGDVVKIITRAGVETGFSRPAPTAPDL